MKRGNSKPPMRCAQDHESPTGAKFCSECGSPLTDGAVQTSYTPRHLVDRVLNSRSALEGERKQVTVLFSDLKGSRALDSQLDSEVLHEVMDDFFAIVTAAVHRYQGTINQYTSDGAMALFGAPIAIEDHAQHACLAALDLRDRLRQYDAEMRLRGIVLAARIGLNSGEVVVGKIGDDLRMDYTAIGATVGVAARMEQMAEPGSIYVSPHTERLVREGFVLRDLGHVAVKGVEQPLQVFELCGRGRARTRLDRSRARGFSRFVGRDTEVAWVETAIEQVVGGEGQILGITAEAGTGKSRLCEEIAARCAVRGMDVITTRGVEHGRSVPLLPILDLFRACFHIAEDDTPEAARDKMRGQLLERDPGLRDELPLLFDFLGVPDPLDPPQPLPPEVRQRLLYSLAERLLRLLAESKPLVALLDDIHWFDGASKAFLDALVEGLPGTRIFFLVNFRPEFQAPWKSKPYYRELRLAPLESEATRELLRDLLGTAASVDELGAQLQAHTGGNPLFVEEIVRALLEADSLREEGGRFVLGKALADLGLPSTVQGLLAARIDRLPEHPKLLLQTASVIGRQFDQEVLERVLDKLDERPDPEEVAGALRLLIQSELLLGMIGASSAEYRFRHPLALEVAYHAQLGKRRQRVHRAVAEVLQEVSGSRLEERAGLIAHNWERAGERLEAARWERRAAQWAGINDPTEAARHWRKVRSLVDLVPESSLAIELGATACTQLVHLGWRLGMTRQQAAELFGDAKTWVQRTGSARSLAVLILGYGQVRASAGDVQELLLQCAEAGRIASQTADAGLELSIRGATVYAQFLTGDLRQALRTTEECLAAPPADPRIGSDFLGFSAYMWLVMYRGRIRLEMGDLAGAVADLDHAAKLAREQGSAGFLGLIHSFHVHIGLLGGDAGSVLEHARFAFDTAERIRTAYTRVTGHGALGEARLVRGEWPQAIVALETALATARENHTRLEHEAFLLTLLAQAQAGDGDAARACETAREAVAVARRQGVRLYECQAQLALAAALVTCGDPMLADAASALARAEALIEETGSTSWRPLLRRTRAELVRRSGDEIAYARGIAEAERMRRDMVTPIVLSARASGGVVE